MVEKATKLIVNYIPQTMTDLEFQSIFIPIGPLESCKIMRDFKTGYSYGFGFVNYIRAKDAERAIQQLNGLEIQNKRIKVSYSRPSGDNIKDTNLYVTNLPKYYTEYNLEKLFSPYGTIVQKNLLFDKITKMPKGVGFVRFSLKEEAQEAISRLHGSLPTGAISPLTVRVAEEHGKMKAAYYAGLKDGLKQHGDEGFINPRGRRGPLHGFPRVHVGNIRGNRRNANNFISNPYNSNYFPNDAYNDNLISYPIAHRGSNGFGALRQDKFQKRFNPLSFGMPNNGYSR